MLWAAEKKVYAIEPLGKCPLGFSKRPIRRAKSRFGIPKKCEFGITANAVFGSDRLIGQLMLPNELSNEEKYICLPGQLSKRLRKD